MNNYNDMAFKMTKISTLCYTIVVCALLVLTLSFPNVILVQRVIIYINFILLIFFEVNTRYFFVIILKSDPIIISMIILIQYLFILTFYFNKMIDFFEGSLLFLTKAIIYYCVYNAFFDISIHFRFGVYQIMNCIICTVSYFYVKEHRKSFYYCKVAETSRLWYHNILENMNTGFLSLSKTKIVYINKSLMSLFDTIKEEILSEYDGLIVVKKSELMKRDLIFSVIDEIFKNTKQDGIGIEPANLNLESVKKYLKINSQNTFINLGICSIVGSKIKSIHFQIHGRYYTSHSLNGTKENFDFIFNDISRIKKNEQINTEFKYKSMFLSKVAHEFKNPILCITDLAEQVKENLEGFFSYNDVSKEVLKKTREILASIKSMSDYMLILIKDMDYFSMKTNTNRKFSIDNDVINVKKFLSFVQDITNVLIKKFNKENSISFEIRYNYLPKEIISDEIKLKQTLINLLSNGVKYTLHGKVILDLLFLDNELQIKVIDTGKGINQEMAKDLFQPFIEQNKDFNYIGAGLGLNIVKDIVSLFGSNIIYEPNIPEGSIFKFTIKVEVVNNIQSNRLSSNNNNLNNSETDTVIFDYYPVMGQNLENELQVEGQYSSLAINNVNEVNPLNEKIIIVVDDEVMTRKATVRLINTFCTANGIRITILECSDGIECLWHYYQSMLKGEKISLVFSDETMAFMNGLYSANILSELCKLRGLPKIPFFLVTAYESLQDFQMSSAIVDIFSKPLNKKTLQKAFVYSSILCAN
jgi:signal transduction histidine kinase/CheY-like chemotaxis protein